VSITEILNERESKYGQFTDLATAAQAFKSITRAAPAYPRMTSVQREAMEMILLKVCRVIYGDPMHFDSWRDIAGYAALAVEEFSPRQDGKPMEPAANPTTPMEMLQTVSGGL
jgi:hypothetical protein